MLRLTMVQSRRAGGLKLLLRSARVTRATFGLPVGQQFSTRQAGRARRAGPASCAGAVLPLDPSTRADSGLPRL